MRGFVETPNAVVDHMVGRLFNATLPREGSRLLDPGSGRGAFVEGVIRWCNQHGKPVPHVVAVEEDRENVASLRARFGDNPSIEIREGNFLTMESESFDFIIGNPPYVPITGITAQERETYRARYRSATNRFDLYILFYERALQVLNPGGTLVFITPEKFVYVEGAGALRKMIAALDCRELEFVDERTFGDLITYPLISTVRNSAPSVTTVVARDGACRTLSLPHDGRSWLSSEQGGNYTDGPTLIDISARVSCGVATGADSVFVKRTREIPVELRRFAYPTIAGRELVPGEDLCSTRSMLIPYDREGRLLREDELGALGTYLADPIRQQKLLGRVCVQRKPWYAFHENPPLQSILRPKIICKDIGAAPFFVIDRAGEIVPRHSIYYIVPRDPDMLDDLCSYLNSVSAQQWLRNHCQRAAGGFLRLQSHTMKMLPVPLELGAARDAEVAALESSPL